MKLTTSTVNRLKLPEGKSELILFDDTLAGFGVRLRAAKRTWIVQYRHGTQQRRMTIGTTSSLAEGEARKRAKTILSKVHLGHDPQSEKLEARRALAPVVTVHTLCEAYLAKAAHRLRPRSLVEVTRHLQTHWAPLHALPIPSVTRSIVAARLHSLARDNGPIAANRARAALSTTFSWAIGEGMADTNPVVGTNKPADEVERDRVLTDAELIEVWRNCAQSTDYGAIIRLLILTGQRRGEVAGMKWSEIDLEKALWTIPAERTKNHRAHVVPLSGACLSILGEKHVCQMAHLKNASGVFTPPPFGLRKRQLDASIQVAPWHLHDLRRTAATRMIDLGTSPHVVEAVLNHVSGHKAGVAGVYNRSLYETEKRTALNIWAERVISLAEGREHIVVSIRR